MNLQNMATNTKRSMIITGGIFLLAAGIYFFAVEPTEKQLSETNQRLIDRQSEYDRMMMKLNGKQKINARLEECKTEMKVYSDALIRPLLQSNAMRAKSLLDTVVGGVGMTDAEYEELPQLALPVPKKKLPDQLFARCPIRVTASGSYQKAVSFILQVEKMFPLVTLQSFSIGVGQKPESQRLEFIFEWPVKGKTTKTQVINIK